MSQQIQLRRGTAAAWASANPTLASGEIGLETDTNRFKIGDGATLYASLGYVPSTSAVNNWAKTQTSGLAAMAFAGTLTFDRDTHGNHINVAALTSNIVIANPTGFTNAVTLNVWLTQDATGSRLISSVGSKIKTAGGSALVLSTGANVRDFLSLVYNPTLDIWLAGLAKGIA